jgi:hypothetical protein
LRRERISSMILYLNNLFIWGWKRR